MKSLSSLVRKASSLQSTHRRTFGNANMTKRKQLRRLKKINYYNKQISGQSNPNSWFIPKRLKAMGNQIQTIKNNHIGSNPITPETRKQIGKTMQQMADYQYWNFRNRERQLIQFHQYTEGCNIDEWIPKLPIKMRKDLQATEPVPAPEIAQPLLKYIEQLNIFLPQDQRYRYNLMVKILYPPKATLQDRAQ